MSSLSKTLPIRMVRTRRHIYSPREVDRNAERKQQRNSLLDQSRSLLINVKSNTATGSQDRKVEIKKKSGRQRKVNASKKMKLNQNSVKINVTKRKINLSLSNEQQIKKRKKNQQSLLNFCTSTPKTGRKRRIKPKRRGKTRYSASFLKTPTFKYASPHNSLYHLNSTIKLTRNISKKKPSGPSEASSASTIEICDKNAEVIDLVSPPESDNESEKERNVDIPIENDSIIILDQTGSASFKTQPFKFPVSIKKFADDDSVIIVDDAENATIKRAALKESIGVQMSPQFIRKNDAATNTSKQNISRTKINIATNTTVVDLTKTNNNNSKTKGQSASNCLSTQTANSSKMAVNMPLQQMNLNFSTKTTEQMTDFIKRIAYLEEQFLKHSVEAPPAITNPGKSNGSTFGSNIYNPSVPLKKGLRLVVIDGSNVAMGHSNGKFFSCEGLKICIDYFIQRGHEVKAFVPQYRRQINQSSNPTLLENLAKVGLVIFTPSRRVHGRMIVPYDDRYIVQCAAERGGVIVSNDNYRDLLQENPSWRETIERRLLMWTWCGNMIMFPIDPCGRGGPSLDQFLRF